VYVPDTPVPEPVPLKKVSQPEKPELSERFLKAVPYTPSKAPFFLFSSPLNWDEREGWNLEGRYNSCGGLEGGSDDGLMKHMSQSSIPMVFRFPHNPDDPEFLATTLLMKV
jgi:hypothetical protein